MKRSEPSRRGVGALHVRRVVSPSHELVDFPEGTPGWDQALAETVEAWDLRPSKKLGAKAPDRPQCEVRTTPPFGEQRPAPPLPVVCRLNGAPTPRMNDPFVGFAVSFPHSEGAKPIEYQVNPVFLKNVFGWDG